MIRIVRVLLVALIAAFATQANAIFLTPDWFDPTNPGVGTNRYAYSHNDPINLADPGGNATNSDSAYMSQDSYHGDDAEDAGSNLPDHITRLSRSERNELYPDAVWEDKETGFRAAAYRNSQTGEITIAFAGTQNGIDWSNNLEQGWTANSAQYDQARSLAGIVSGATSNNQGALSFTGHSLGGGLAMEAANSLAHRGGYDNINYHRDVKTFNAAGISHTVSEGPRNIWNGLSGANRYMHNNVVIGDPVSTLNAISPGMGTFGSVDYYAPNSFNSLVNHGLTPFMGKLGDGGF